MAGWLSKLSTRIKDSLRDSSQKVVGQIQEVLTRRKLDAAALDELEESLILSDLGVELSAQLVDTLRGKKFPPDIDMATVQDVLATEIETILKPSETAWDIPEKADHPYVILMVGANGSGKTTTIAKIAHHLTQQKRRVRLVAGDTFRAAAIEQLGIWAERLKLPLESTKPNGDAAGLAFDAYKKAVEHKDDVLIIDTAGRLHHREDLMAELEKIKRTLAKHRMDAPDLVLLTLDATMGQNALQQVGAFIEKVNINGLIMTKIDGTAKGGVLVSLVHKFKLPVFALGLGESLEDFSLFSAHDYAQSLVGLGSAK